MIYNFTLLERFLLSKNILPTPVIDSLTLVIAGRVIQISVKIGIFDTLKNSDPKSIKEIATKSNISENGTEVLIDCLESLGYVEKLDNKYQVTSKSKKFLVTSSKTTLKNTILFTDYVFDALNELEDNVRRGGPKNVNLSVFTNAQWETFNKAMAEIASANVSEILKKVPISNKYRRLLDLGGSHGIHSIAFCKKYPNLSAEILDLKPTQSQAEKIIKENKMEAKVKFKIGDFLKDDIEEKFDVVLAFNVIHGMNSTTNSKLTNKIYKSINPGGTFVIMDQIKDARSGSQLTKTGATTMGVMLFNQAGGKTYTLAEVKNWLTTTGFLKVEMKKMRDPGSAIIIASKN